MDFSPPSQPAFKRQLQYFVLWLLGLALVFVAFKATAHSDMSKPLFVAENGTDSGRCLDATAPCRTIAYALSRVGKGGQIRVAGGRYDISDPADVFHIVSGLTTVHGGFDAADGFRQPAGTKTTITGVPPAYRSMMASRGFHVIADTKSLPDAVEENARATRKMLAMHEQLQQSMAPTPCVNGSVNGMACDDTELLSHVAFSGTSANPGASADVWGFVDLNNDREYAIIGYNIGTAVFDVTDPEAPREIGFIDGQNTTWRDIKVYQYYDTNAARWQAYAYVTTDGSTDGLFVIDLTELPQRISRQPYNSDFSAAHNVFAANTDYGTGLSLTGDTPTLIIAGANNGGGGFRIYSLNDATAPGFVAQPTSDYMHDAATMIIRDSRKDTQCANATTEYCEVLFDFNESSVDVWDITDPNNAVRLSRTTYNNSAYTHSGWPSEDGQYLFMHDELDEQNFGLQTTVRSFSLADLTNPLPSVGVFNGPSTAIDHNGFVRGNRYYMSNYSRGLTILDTTDPTSLVTTGLLDTYPFSDNASFVGAWGAFPYFHSGHIAVSDISSGLYMVGDNTLDSANGQLAFSTSNFSGDEGTSVNVEVQRLGGSAGAVSADVQLVPATASNSDIASQTGTLSWADGDTASKTISFSIASDADTEGLERMLVKLIAPTGGATLARGSVANLWLSDAGASSTIEFSNASQDIDERGVGFVVVTVQRSGSAAGTASVNYALSSGDATDGTDYTGASSGTLDWADGDAAPKSIEFEIVNDNDAEPNEFFELALSAPSGAVIGSTSTSRVNILDGSASNQAPNAVAGASQTVASGATVTLNGSASSDPNNDTLTYNWTQTMGASVTINNATSASATFTAPTVSSDTLLQFQLEVTDSGSLTDTATTNVTVQAQSSGGGGSSGGSSGGGGGGSVSLLLLVLASFLAWQRLVALPRAIRTDAA